MKKFFLPVVLVLFCASCSVDESLESIDRADPDIHFPVDDSGSCTELLPEIFDLLDLDYPGLESVKQFVKDESWDFAAYALLDYYRQRDNVVNPLVDLSLISNTDQELNMAEQATKVNGYRFYVRNYSESANGGFVDKQPLYYSFEQNGIIDWTTNPEQVNNAQEWRYQKHRLQWMEPQARVYAVTKNDKYAEAWVDIFTQWYNANSFLQYEDGTYVLKNEDKDGEGVTYNKIRQPGFPDEIESPWSGLQTSERLEALLNSFFYYIDSKALTPQFLTTFLVSVYDHAENMIANPWGEANSNIRLSQYQSLLYASVYFPEFRKSSDWRADAVRKIENSLDIQFYDDGMQNELDLSYHIGVVADFIDIDKVAKANDVTFSPDYISKLHGATLIVRDMMYTNYTLENFNDTRSGDGKKSSLLRNFKAYDSMFPDDNEFLYVSTEGQSGEAPSSDLKVYEKSGFYSFRTGWTPEDMVMVFKNHYAESLKPWHSQADNGHFGLYRNGRRFTPDAGVPSYGGSETTNGYRKAHASTRAHNTMNVGGKDIDDNHVKGKYLASGVSEGNIEYLVFENPSYDNLTHRRAVFFVNKTFFVILDEGYGANEVKDVELCFNLCESKNVDFDKEESATKIVGAHTKFSDANNMLFKTFAETDAKELLATTGYYCNDIIDDDYNGKRIQRKLYRVIVDKPANKAARMITVIYPFGAAADYSTLAVNAEFTDNAGKEAGTFDPNGATVKVTVNGIDYTLSYSLNN